MSCLSLVEHIIENCTDTYPHQTEILDGRWRSYDEFDEAVDEIFALLDQGELWSIEDLYYMYHSVFRNWIWRITREFTLNITT